MNLILPLLITIFSEFIIYAFFIRKNFLLLFGYSILINSLTNPVSNILFSFGVNLFLIEFSAFVIESILLKSLLKIKWKESIIISFVANLISFFSSFIL